MEKGSVYCMSDHRIFILETMPHSAIVIEWEGDHNVAYVKVLSEETIETYYEKDEDPDRAWWIDYAVDYLESRAA